MTIDCLVITCQPGFSQEAKNLGVDVYVCQHPPRDAEERIVLPLAHPHVGDVQGSGLALQEPEHGVHLTAPPSTHNFT